MDAQILHREQVLLVSPWFEEGRRAQVTSSIPQSTREEPPSMLHDFSSPTPSKHGKQKDYLLTGPRVLIRQDFLSFQIKFGIGCVQSLSLGGEKLHGRTVLSSLHIQFSLWIGLFLWMVWHRWGVVWPWGSLQRCWGGFQTFLAIPVQGGKLLYFPT